MNRPAPTAPAYEMTEVKPGTKVRTLYQFSETGTILRPRKVNLPLPGPDWYMISFDAGGGACIHRSMFTLANA